MTGDNSSGGKSIRKPIRLTIRNEQRLPPDYRLGAVVRGWPVPCRSTAEIVTGKRRQTNLAKWGAISQSEQRARVRVTKAETEHRMETEAT